MTCSVITFRSKLERSLKKPFKHKRLIWAANIALFLAIFLWSLERMVFAASHMPRTLADDIVMLLAGIAGLIAIIVSYRMQKREIKKSEDLDRGPLANSGPS
ncbi:MAG: hypothetical protein F4Z66_03670 [Gammaproteobacteria bacterium]|nr:hypothetical protein [Gammaproteobacteria bacterium]